MDPINWASSHHNSKLQWPWALLSLYINPQMDENYTFQHVENAAVDHQSVGVDTHILAKCGGDHSCAPNKQQETRHC